MLRSLINRLRTVGPLATGGCLLYRLAQRLMTLDVSRLVWLDGREARFRAPTDPGLTFCFLTPEEVREFSADPSNLLDESFTDRLEGGQHFCFAALSSSPASSPSKGRRLAAYAWFVPHRVDAECNQGRHKNTGVNFSYPDHAVFMYKGFTHPEFRGRGLYGMVNGLAIRAFSDRGITHILSTMDWTNVSARRSCCRLGFSELGLVVRWGWGRWMHTHAPRVASSLGIQVESEMVRNASMVMMGAGYLSHHPAQ